MLRSLFFLLLLAPGGASANVFGKDDREALAFPTPVGRLDFGPERFCSGTLIGPARLLTAAHCLIDEETQLPKQPLPLFSVRDAEGSWHHAKISSLRWSGRDPAEYRGSDLVEAELNLPLGWRVGYWPTEERRFEGLYRGVEEALTLVAFHHDLDHEKTYRSTGLIRRDYDNGELSHDIDLTGGASGGALVISERPDLKDARVVAVQSMHFPFGTEFYTRFTNGTRNVAARWRASLARDAATYHPLPPPAPLLCPTPAAWP